MLDNIDLLHNSRLQALKQQTESVQTEAEKRKFLITLVKVIVDAINTKTIDTIEQGVDINNFDEIQASLRNELTKANKPISDLLKELNLSTKEQTKVTAEIQNKLLNKFAQYQTVVVKRVNDVVQVENLEDIQFPSELSINNLITLEQKLQEVIDKISALKLDVTLPAPQVSVNPTPVNIPQTVLNVPEVDLEPIIKSIELNFNKIRTNSETRPLAVRLSDGQAWIKELIKVQKETSKAVAAFSGGSDQIRLLDGNRNPVNPAGAEGQTIASSLGDGAKNVTIAGTRVQLIATVTPCKWVTIVALASNTNSIYIGGITIAAARGRPIVALQAETLYINDVSKIYIDADTNGEGVTFIYGS